MLVTDKTTGREFRVRLQVEAINRDTRQPATQTDFANGQVGYNYLGVIYDDNGDITNGAWENSVADAIQSAIVLPAFFHLEDKVTL